MPNIYVSQNIFSVGELSPLMYGRTDIKQYYNSMKTARNVITYPQGAAGKRFGTIYRATIPNVVDNTQIFFQVFSYLNQCDYQVAFQPDSVNIYLEGSLQYTVTSTGLDAHAVSIMDYTVLEDAFVIAGFGFRPKQLLRAPIPVPNIIISTTSNNFLLTTPVTSDQVVPVKFTTSGTLPVTTPQVVIGVVYFAKNISGSRAEIYPTSKDAIYGTNIIAITNIGTGVNNITYQNVWTLPNIGFKNVPVFDFDGGYDTITFTPSAISGTVTITLSAPLTAPAGLTSKYVGGAFFGNGGIGRIISVTDNKHFVINVTQSFDSTAAIPGTLALLTEPAWSDARGWPQKCSSYQNRAVFANSASLPNGVWLSFINDYSDFNDTTTDDDAAISWYPTSDAVNVIQFIVPYRSLTIHTNSAVYSNPLAFDLAVTPKTFTLQLQDSTPASKLQPRGIDNQIIIISGNDVHSLVWEGINNAYTSSIVSTSNEQLIDNPVDEAPYIDLRRAGSRYVFIVNEDGSMAIFQTLITEDVRGFTKATLTQEYGNAYFRQAATSINGRGWFLTERQIAVAGTNGGLNAIVSPTILQSLTMSFPIGEVTAGIFGTSDVLATSSPQITTTQYYWFVGIDATNFYVYTTYTDAVAGTNPITWSSIGHLTTITEWPLTSEWMIEELSFDVFTDCSFLYSGTPISTITGLSRFDAQAIKINGDGFGFNEDVFNDQATLTDHGITVTASNIYGGFAIDTVIELLPISVGLTGTTSSTNVVQAKHIRMAKFMFNNTIGGTINGVDIAIPTLNQVIPGNPPIPQNGIFEIASMAGWNDYTLPTFTIEHTDPYDIRLIGVFYTVEV